MRTIATVASAVLILVGAGCGSRTTDGDPSGRLGDGCATNADCADPYLCSNSVCSFPCLGCSGCTPGVKACINETVGTCRADGSGFELAPTACATGCFQGACRPPSCEAGVEQQCDGDLIRRCNATGSGFETDFVCPTGCETTADGVVCRREPDAGTP